MSDYTTFRDPKKTPLLQRVALHILNNPRTTTATMRPHFPDATLGNVRQSVSQLKAHGFVRAEKIAGSFPAQARYYTATSKLRLMIEQHGAVELRRKMVDEDEEWTPPTTYIGGTRAVILGLRKAA